MMKIIKRFMFHSDEGSAVVEFAIVLPILLLVVFGVINFGVLLYNQSVITNSAREGSRWAAIHSSASYGNTCTNSYSVTPVDPCQVAYSAATSAVLSFGTSQLAAAFTAANYNPGTAQSVTVTYFYTGIGWFFGSQGSNPYSFTAVMLHE
jgi:Flp pilus assembly protein TadG